MRQRLTNDDDQPHTDSAQTEGLEEEEIITDAEPRPVAPTEESEASKPDDKDEMSDLEEGQNWADTDEERYKLNRERVKEFARQKLTGENTPSTDETTVEITNIARKSDQPCQLEHLTGPSQLRTMPHSPRNGQSHSSRSRNISIVSQGEQPINRFRQDQSIESIKTSNEPDDVFELPNPEQESIFVYQAPTKSRKLKKNLLKFQSPPPPSEMETTVIVETEDGPATSGANRRIKANMRLNTHQCSDSQSCRHRSSSFTDQPRHKHHKRKTSYSSSDVDSVTRVVFKPPHTSTDAVIRDEPINFSRERQGAKNLPGTLSGFVLPKRPKRTRKTKKTDTKDLSKPGRIIQMFKNAWAYDTTVSWYHFKGKGAAWLVVLTPFILLFGPFLMSCYIFNLNNRSRQCWHKCWKVDTKYDWFNCKGKGTGWSFLLILLYLILSPLLILFTLFTFLGLFMCSVGQNGSERRAQSDVNETQSDLKKSARGNPFMTT